MNVVEWTVLAVHTFLMKSKLGEKRATSVT